MEIIYPAYNDSGISPTFELRPYDPLEMQGKERYKYIKWKRVMSLNKIETSTVRN